MKTWQSLWSLGCLASFGLAGVGHAQGAEEQKLIDAALAFEEFQGDPATAIPTQILQEAQGIAVLPNVIRAGFIFGGQRGKGVAVIRSENGEWSNPLFIKVTGGSFGAQIGGESTDLILIFGNARSVRNIGAGKFTFNSEASATAGPVGRGARAATDMRFSTEVYYYARGRGLFAGAALGGVKLNGDAAANGKYYPPTGLDVPLGEPAGTTPASARRLLSTLARAEMLAGSGASPARAGQLGEPAAEAGEGAVIYPLGGGTAAR